MEEAEEKCAAHEIENASKEIDDLLRTLVDAGVRAKEEEKEKKKKKNIRGAAREGMETPIARYSANTILLIARNE